MFSTLQVCEMLESSAMLKVFKMPFLRNARKRNPQESARPDGPDSHRAKLQGFKSMLEKMEAIDLSEFGQAGFPRAAGIDKHMQKLLASYARNGRALWEYARAVTDNLPEAERAREMDEVRRLLERAGFRKSMNEA